MTRFFKTTRYIRFAGFLVASAMGCAVGQQDDITGGGSDLAPLPVPSIKMLTPSPISAGETMNILMEGIPIPELGHTELVFNGAYQSQSGRQNAVQLTVRPTYVDNGTVTWKFGPNIPFTTEPDIGVFSGTVQAINVRVDGETTPSDPVQTTINVGPSIIVRGIGTAQTACHPGITSTIEDQDFSLAVEAIGLQEASASNPTRFAYVFLGEHFRFDGDLEGAFNNNPDIVNGIKGPIMVIDEVRQGRESGIGAGRPRTMYVHKEEVSSLAFSAVTQAAAKWIDERANFNAFGRVHLKTVSLPDPDPKNHFLANSHDAAITVVAIDAGGREAKRSIDLRIWRPVEIRYEGKRDIAKVYESNPVSACYFGGDWGTSVTKATIETESKERMIEIQNRFDGSVKVPFIDVAQISGSFGSEIEGAVNSSIARSDGQTKPLIAGHWGVWFSQWIEYDLTAKLITHGPCGDSQEIGSVIVRDYSFSHTLGTKVGNVGDCPPLPPTPYGPEKTYRAAR